ncbi:SMIM5 protein, partial [Bucco capensis]|nr:SMIM5 protein [Bucco capensis]
MSSEGFLKEMQTIGEKFLLKLQRLPKADPVEIVSFCVVLLFIVTVVLLMIIACSCCCSSCCGCAGSHPEHRRRKIQVRPIAH